MMRTSVSILLFSMATCLMAQDQKEPYILNKTSFGIGATYNFGTKAKGIVGRIEMPVIRPISVVSMFSYYPEYKSTNTEYESIGISEYYAHVLVAVSVIQTRSFRTYLAAGGSLSKWANHRKFDRASSRRVTIGADALAGVDVTINQVTLFSELDYNFYWGEAHFNIGLLVKPFRSGSNKEIAGLPCPTF